MYRRRLAFALAMAALAAILVPSSLTAQITFERTYGGAAFDCGYSVQQTTDGGCIVAGSTWSYGPGSGHVYLIKTNACGDTLWTRTFGGTEWDQGNSVRQTADGGYIIAGWTESFGAGEYDVYLIKTDAGGDRLWTRTYGGTTYDYGYSVQQTADGGYVVAGFTGSYGAGQKDVYLVKTDEDGDTVWTRTFGGTCDDEGWSIRQTADGGYIVTGYTQPLATDMPDVYLIKTDSLGVALWTRTFGGLDIDYGCCVEQTKDSGYIIAGYTNSLGVGEGDVFLIKTNALGDSLWTKTFGGSDVDWGKSVQQATDGGYIIVGRTLSFGPGGNDVWLIRTNAGGIAQWTKRFGNTDEDEGYSVQQTADGGYVVAGSTRSVGPHLYDVYLIKTDSLGNVAVAEPKASPTRAPALSFSCEPNPFRTRTAISLQLTADSPAELAIFDAAGRRVRTFTVNRKPCAVWDGTDELGNALPSGTYFAVLAAGGLRATARLVLQR